MSYQALDWVDQLEHDRVPYLPYRVLLKLANVADVHGKCAWRSKAMLADELGVTQRSIQAAFKTLQNHRFIKRGEQRHVAHLPANRRPVVYDLALTKQSRELFDMDEFEGLEPEVQGRSSGEKLRGEAVIHNPGSGEKPPRFRTPYRRTDISTTHSDPTTSTRATCAEGHPLHLDQDWHVVCREGHPAAETVTA